MEYSNKSKVSICVDCAKAEACVRGQENLNLLTVGRLLRLNVETGKTNPLTA